MMRSERLQAAVAEVDNAPNREAALARMRKNNIDFDAFVTRLMEEAGVYERDGEGRLRMVPD